MKRKKDVVNRKGDRQGTGPHTLNPRTSEAAMKPMGERASPSKGLGRELEWAGQEPLEGLQVADLIHAQQASCLGWEAQRVPYI